MNKLYGRKEEINWLYGAFESVAIKDEKGNYTGPKILALLSESGIGKSRLVQEMYCKIAKDDKYNPPEIAYWPEQFGDGGVNLNVSPKMNHQSPKGAPKFLWIGARWRPEDRNTLSRASVFPEIKQELAIHNIIMQKMSPALQALKGKITDKITSDFLGDSGVELISKTFDATMPFLGLLAGVLKTAAEVTIDRRIAFEGFAQQKSLIEHVEVEEMLKIFRKLLGDKNSIPIVFWLDDAHWADELMQSFLKILVYEAKMKKWPLLLVITHWEREYYEQTKPTSHTLAPREISSLIKELSESDRRVLKKIENEYIKQYLKQELPGLTSSNIELLCNKADGNFLTMVENVGQLLAQPRYFIDGTPISALNDKGVRNVDSFETDRKKRVKQRFDTLDPIELQDVLAVGAEQGVRFIPELIIKCLDGENYSSHYIDQCIDPYAILSRLEQSSDLREFRDNLYADVALQHFIEFYDDKREKFDCIIKEWLSNQISSCFDEHGNIKESTSEEKLYFINGSLQEQLTLINLAKAKLNLSVFTPQNAQFVYLAVRSFDSDRQWSEIRTFAKITEGWEWLLSKFTFKTFIDNLDYLLDRYIYSGATSHTLNLANAIYEQKLETTKELDSTIRNLELGFSLQNIALIEQSHGNLKVALTRNQEALVIFQRRSKLLNTPESREEVCISMHGMAAIEHAKGNLSAAFTWYQQALEISRRLFKDIDNPEYHRHVSTCLINMARIEREQGNLLSALTRSQEALVIFQRLAKLLNTPQSNQDVCSGMLGMAGIEQAQGNLSAAFTWYQQALEISRRLVKEINIPEFHRHVNISLINMARIEREQGNLLSALTRSKESLLICQRLDKEINTPEIRLSVSVSLSEIARIEQVNGNLSVALDNAKEGLEILRRVADELDTQESHRAVSQCLELIADITYERGDLTAALDNIKECLSISRRLAKELDTPESHRKMSISMGLLAEIEHKQGNHQGALAMYKEGLEINRRLNIDFETQESLGLIKYFLNEISQLE